MHRVNKEFGKAYPAFHQSACTPAHHCFFNHPGAIFQDGFRADRDAAGGMPHAHLAIADIADDAIDQGAIKRCGNCHGNRSCASDRMVKLAH